MNDMIFSIMVCSFIVIVSVFVYLLPARSVYLIVAVWVPIGSLKSRVDFFLGSVIFFVILLRMIVISFAVSFFVSMARVAVLAM